MPTPTKVRIKFDGHDLPHGRIDLYDFVDTIVAFGETAKRIAENENLLGDENRLRIDVQALEAGSFQTELLMCVEPVKASLPLLPVAAGAVQNAEHIVKILKGVISLKRWLKGQKPKEAKPASIVSGKGAMMNVYNFQGEHMTVNMSVYQNAQDSQVVDGLTRIGAPVKREGSPIDSITIDADGAAGKEPEVIQKGEIAYLEESEESQVMPDFTLKGIVSRFDTKTQNGKITLSDGARRVSFELAGIHPAQYDKAMKDLIDSMKQKLTVKLVGDATIDMNGNVKKLQVKKVEPETTLL